MYLEYIKYVIDHKNNICKSADYWYKVWTEDPLYANDKKAKRKLKRTLRKIKFTHDWTKFLPKEFFPYAKWFYGDYGVKMKKEFEENPLGMDGYTRRMYRVIKSECDKSIYHHYSKNGHHWNHWCFDWDKYDGEHPEECKRIIPNRMPSKYIIEMIVDWTAMGYRFGNTAQEYYLKNYHNIEIHDNTRFVLEMKLGLIRRFKCQIPDDLAWMTLKEIKRCGYDLNEIIDYPDVDFNNYNI